MYKKVQFVLVGLMFSLMLFSGSIEAAPVDLNKSKSLEERLERFPPGAVAGLSEAPKEP